MRVLAGALALIGTCLANPRAVPARSVQEAILLAKPAVVLVTARVDAEITLTCGRGPAVTVKPAPFVETGTGWFVDGHGYLVTNAHVVDPAHRMPPWVIHELRKKAIDQACVDPVLKARGLVRGQRPHVEERLRLEVTDRVLATDEVDARPQVNVLLSNGERLTAEVKKFSPPPSLDANNKPRPEWGRDLALLRVKDGTYPAISLMNRDAKIGDPVHILGFPGVVLSHELLNQSLTREASATNGAVSGFQKDAIGQDMVQTDAPATHGNSGGPAITDDSSLLGVMDFVSMSSEGEVAQGFNFLIPARDVRAFLEGTGVNPGESKFNPAWAAGVDALFNGRYAAAAARIGEANKLLPNLVDVKRTLDEAELKVKNPPPRPFPWGWTTLGVSLLSAGAYGGMFARRWWQNRFRVLPGQVIGFIENGQNPILLDVRRKTDLETSPLRLPGAIRLDPEAVDAGRIDLQVDPGQMIVTYCTSPLEATSARVTEKLRERGFKNVRILKGGLGGWTNARLPVEAKSHLPSIGLEIYKNLTVGDLERRRFKPGELIFKEGTEAQGEAYLIHSGTVEIHRVFDGEDRVLSTMKEGELFGEVAIFRDAPRSANAIAANEVELLVIKNERLDWLIRNRPQVTMEVLKRLANWLVQTDRERAPANR